MSTSAYLIAQFWSTAFPSFASLSPLAQHKRAAARRRSDNGMAGEMSCLSCAEKSLASQWMHNRCGRSSFVNAGQRTPCLQTEFKRSTSGAL